MVASRGAFWTGRRVLVTGGAGFIGFALAERLAKRGASVTVLDIKKGLPAYASSDARRKIRHVRGNVASEGAVHRVLRDRKIETIFHLAAEAIVGRALNDPEKALESNVKGTWVLLEGARRASRIREIVVASSDKAYGSHAKLPYTEDAALRGINPYDASKTCADIIAQMYAHSYGIPIAIARCGNVYGPGDLNWSRLIPSALRSSARGRTLDIRSDGTFRRDYIFIEDIVDAYMTLAEQLIPKKLAGEAFNFGNNKPLRVVDVLKEIQRSVHLEYRISNTAKNEIRDQYLDSRKAARVLKWKPRTAPRKGFSATARWYASFFKKDNS